MKKVHLPVLSTSPVPARVTSISTDYAANTLTASMRINGTFAEEEVVLELWRKEHEVARGLLTQLYQEVNKWRNEAGDKNCGTCRGTCCTSRWGEFGITLTQEDVQRLADHLGVTPIQVSFKYLSSNPSANDEQFAFEYRDEPKATSGKCCPFLSIDDKGLGRCTVYEARPRVCREFTAYGCTIYEKLPGGDK